jgi:exopolyphosphatase/pppGpp-phosphohydrolase
MPHTLVNRRASRRVAVLRDWVHDHLGDVRHERRVAHIAVKLARIARPLHSLRPEHGRLLKMAALVHDVGRAKEKKDHPNLGARLILRRDKLPLSPFERRALAYLTRYHRGQVPEIGQDGILKPEDDLDAMRTLLAFLRAADAMDCRSLPSPRLRIQLDGRQLRIVCGLVDDTSKARRVFSRRKKLRLLEEILDCDVRVEVRSAAKLAAVA